MILTEVGCGCGAVYRCAESETLEGEPGQLKCGNCGAIVVRWLTAHKRVYRCVIAPDRGYPVVVPPPSP
ncbi:hypothetical protein ACTZWT_18265 [Rhodopseudomonas sp. NSM]|uniref:hypothetical protein n=1 Tax=Rhodopseudomonas sp. NSM TaxID=3457630 RepID=UPI0040363D77